MKKYKITILYPTSNQYAYGQTKERIIEGSMIMGDHAYKFYNEKNAFIASFPVQLSIVEVINEESK